MAYKNIITGIVVSDEHYRISVDDVDKKNYMKVSDEVASEDMATVYQVQEGVVNPAERVDPVDYDKSAQKREKKSEQPISPEEFITGVKEPKEQ